MRVLDKAQTRALKVRARMRFSLRGAVVGALVVPAYAAAIWWVWRAADLPVPVLVLNGVIWAFFFWAWQRNLRRVLSGARPFALAVTDRAVVVPLFGIDRSVPPELDRAVEVGSTEVAEATFVDQRTIVRTLHGQHRRIESLRTPVLRLRLREPMPDALREALAAMNGRPGFQGNHVHLVSDTVLEVFFDAGQADDVTAVLATLDPRLKPRRLQATDDLTETLDDGALARLESAGRGMTVHQARRAAAGLLPGSGTR